MKVATYPRAVFAAELPAVTDWMQAWEDLRDGLVAALAVVDPATATVYKRPGKWTLKNVRVHPAGGSPTSVRRAGPE